MTEPQPTTTSQLSHNADALLGPGVAERLTDTFERHAAQSQGGMEFSVYRAGEPVIELRAGVAGKRADTSARVWDERTLAVFFSGTKGLVATIAAKAAGEGLLDVEAPVAHYWPEFAAAGKETVSVAQVLSHTVGLPYVDPDPSLDADYRPRADEAQWAFLDSRKMASILAQQAPLWEPGTKVAYHAVTYGYLMSEIILRATGRSVAQWLHEDLAQPFGLDLHLGLPAEDEDRVAPIIQAPGYSISTYLKNDPTRRAVIDRMYASLLAPTLPMNTRAFHAAEISAGGGMGTAAAMAKLYTAGHARPTRRGNRCTRGHGERTADPIGWTRCPQRSAPALRSRFRTHRPDWHLWARRSSLRALWCWREPARSLARGGVRVLIPEQRDAHGERRPAGQGSAAGARRAVR
ncbi:serine hydrolase domain-containing protein [Brevibacterium zhoupengii]|uniref:serine hydrolase domain-containing protein n=1 Tax=Brevibacterium zhoupengii TaxID=2898795 RepID=UPI001E451189|nr:serine hydrolase domain-containing protein [Brevibacterium zhoupengii]